MQKIPMNNIKRLLSIVNNPDKLDIKKWKSFPLSSVEAQRHDLSKSINGLYALNHDQWDIIYIGKGKPIYNRLKSHYKATKGFEKAAAWKQFFSYFSDNLTAYWIKVDDDNRIVGEQYRKVLELILQVKYEPIFERLYPDKKNKAISDFEIRLMSLKK